MEEQGTAEGAALLTPETCSRREHLGDFLYGLAHFFVVYGCFICIVGSICNTGVLWCVARCPRTPTPVKVILGAIFSCMMLTCLVLLPFTAHYFLTILHCNETPSEMAWRVVIVVSRSILTQMEFFYISIMALLRARALWSPVRGHLRLRTAVAVVVGVALYIAFVETLVGALAWTDVTTGRAKYAVRVARLVVQYILPVLLTLACYLSSIVAVRRNKRNLQAGQHTAAVTKVMDSATRAMLAVFISNLVLILPFLIYNTLPNDQKLPTTAIIMHMVIDTQLFVDPVMFVLFNGPHRRRVVQCLKSCLCRPPREEDPVALEEVVAEPPPAPRVPARENTC